MKSKTSATLLLLVTFFLGSITGAIGYYLYHSRADPARSERDYRTGPRDAVSDMAKDLSLDAEQTRKLREIFQQSRDRYRELSSQMRPQYDAIRKETQQAIREILTPEQRVRFDEVSSQHDSPHKSRGPRDLR